MGGKNHDNSSKISFLNISIISFVYSLLRLNTKLPLILKRNMQKDWYKSKTNFHMEGMIPEYIREGESGNKDQKQGYCL